MYLLYIYPLTPAARIADDARGAALGGQEELSEHQGGARVYAQGAGRIGHFYTLKISLPVFLFFPAL